MSDHTIQPTGKVPSLGSRSRHGNIDDLTEAISRYAQITGRDVALLTGRFMLESGKNYLAPWLVREIVQNFLDNNPIKGTLENVQFNVRPDLEHSGQWIITVEGNWPITNISGLRAFHSDKSSADAGGNGLALKQLFNIFRERFGVSEFTIEAEEANIEYKKLSPADLNKELNKEGCTVNFDYDVTVTEKIPTGKKRHCKYIIKTSNEELAKAFAPDQVRVMGVSKQNPELQNPDFANEHGMFKWRLPDDEGKLPRGKLYLAGQVCSYQENMVEKENDFWGGPRGVTLALRTPQEKTADRGAINNYSLPGYLKKLVASMTKEQIIRQLKKSEGIWSFVKDDFSNRPGSFILVEALVNELWFGDKKLTPEEFSENFSETVVGGKRFTYIAEEVGGTQQSERAELKKKGYIVCPHYFSRIGMPSVSSVRTNFNTALQAAPEVNTYEQGERARGPGVFITYEQLKCKNTEDFFRELQSRLGANISKITAIKGTDGLFKIYLKTKINKDDLIIPDLSGAKEKEHKNLYFLRGALHYGLSHGIFIPAQTALIQGEVMGKFGTYSYGGFDNLQIKIIDCGTEGASILQVEVAEKDIATFKKVFSEKGTNTKLNNPVTSRDEPDTAIGSTTSIDDTPAKPSLVKHSLLWLAGGSGLLATVLALFFVLRSDQADNNKGANDQLNPPSKGTTDTGLKPKDNPPVVNIKPTETEAEKKLRALLDSKDSTSLVKRDGVLDENSPSLLDVAGKFNKAEIKAATEKLEPRIAESEGHEIKNFKIVLDPNEKQIAKIKLLRAYVEQTLSAGIGNKVSIPTDICLFTGDGVKGVNYGAGKLIGLHEELFKPNVGFGEARATLLHELVHKHYKGHGLGFISMVQSLNAAVTDGHSIIANEAIKNLKAGKGLTDEQIFVLNAGKIWNELDK